MAFTYLKVKSAKCLRLLSVVRGLGLKNLVLFTSLNANVTFHYLRGGGHVFTHVCQSVC